MRESISLLDADLLGLFAHGFEPFLLLLFFFLLFAVFLIHLFNSFYVVAVIETMESHDVARKYQTALVAVVEN